MPVAYNKGFENMMDLDNSSETKECAMVCTDVHYEESDENIIMYGDQGVSTEEHNKTMYGKLTKTECEEEEEVTYNVALCTNDNLSLEKKKKATSAMGIGTGYEKVIQLLVDEKGW